MEGEPMFQVNVSRLTYVEITCLERLLFMNIIDQVRVQTANALE